MYNLLVELEAVNSDKRSINLDNLSKYLEFLCIRFTGQSLEKFEYIISPQSNFKMKCKKISSGVEWEIECELYDDIQNIIQGVFKLKSFEFQGHEFEVASIDMKEIPQKVKLNVV